MAFEAAVMLAGIVPVELMAKKYKNLYLRKKELRERGVEITGKISTILRLQASENAMATWKMRAMRAGGFARCAHCSDGWDSARHTLMFCPAWEAEREVLRGVIGQDLEPPIIVRKILENGDNWTAFSRFSVSLMTAKEEAERARQAAERAPPLPLKDMDAN
ncbi:PREDICTED: uncharacterized protein LOC108767473 [Trachymyrmex cornetzi]|uniref:uncharacterized protein LOC108767473 n=1 Tax=Trachymyrmex cornetzi TaxID=471704 RepID=UPI00084F6253|nr:PREDICTED: uncharacterized protein LOC108767473 [Trachymyrmex cornetzi]